jgi:alkylation response protein AidB-like acyl-CoA dehydrogenase
MSCADFSNLIKNISESIDEWERLKYIPKEGWKLLGENNLIGISFNQENGVSKLADAISQLTVLKKAGLLSAFAINEISFRLLSLFRTQIDTSIMEEIASGNKNISLCITEEKAGSDLGAIESEAVLEDGHYNFKGKKILISNGPIADYFILAIKTNKDVAAWRGITLFLLDKEDVGSKISEPIPAAGAHLMPLGAMELDGIRVSEDKILGKKNRGFEYLMNILLFERVVISILATAMCEDILKTFIKYLNEREIFGKKLKDYQNTKFVVAEMFSRTKVLRNFVDKLIHDYDKNDVDKSNVMISKVMCTELLKDMINNVSQLYGASGYLSEHWIANYYNDIRWTSIAGGANELLLDVLGNNLVHGGS